MKRYRNALRLMAAAAVLAGLFAIMFAQAQGVAPQREAVLVPPPEPAVTPEITRPYDLDSDGDKLDDVLARELAAMRQAIAVEPDADKRAGLMNALNEPVGVELVFSKQVTQDQIDRFLGLGGSISRIFRAVSYGWNGSLPIGQLDQLPAAMGDTFLGAIRFQPLVKHMNEATRTGRVRPIWASGFAGGTGFSGSVTTTIAVLDTGVDDSHTDLAGRMEYWYDWSISAEPNPVDYDGHGSHVAGIAAGTGNAAGLSPASVLYTDGGDMTGVASGSFIVSPVRAETASSSWTGAAHWNDGGSTTLYWAYRNRGSNTGWTTIGGSASGTSPRSKTLGFTGSTSRNFSAALLSNGAITSYAVTNSVTAAGLGDGFNLLRGVAPNCRWAGLKIFQNGGSGTTAEMSAALDDLVVQKSAHNIKVANMSAGISGTNTTLRNKANTVVSNGIVLCVSAGNNGPTQTVYDPARASLVVTVGASSDVNQLTKYTSPGISSPGTTEDYKPDVITPGGSDYQGYLLSVDTNDSDAGKTTFADKRANDYANYKGTSMASPFAAGSAALIVQALESAGTSWDWSTSSTSLLVKMLMCAGATETNVGREGGTNNPTLGRGAAPRDLYEGFGILNPDAACEAASMTAAWGAGVSDSTAGGVYDRRAWGRKLSIENGRQVTLNLTMGAAADYDLYLYSSTPDSVGKPQTLAYSCSTTVGTAESIVHTPSYTGTAYVFIKRVSGSGSFTFTPTQAAGSSITVTAPNGAESWQMGSAHDITWTYSGSPGSDVKIELYKAGSYLRDIVASTSVGSSGTGSYSWTLPTDLTAAMDYKVNVASTTTSAADVSNANLTIALAATTLAVEAKAGQIGQTISLSATLTRTDSSAEIAGKAVAFTVDSVAAGSGTTSASGVATVSYTIQESLGVGTVAIGASFGGDTAYGSATGTADLVTSKSATATVSGMASGAIGQTVSLTATLTRSTDSEALAGKTVSFTVEGSAAGSGTTDASGVASVSFVITEALGTGAKTIQASFAGDTLYNASSGSSTLTVGKSDTAISVPAKSGAIGGTVTLTATLSRTSDGGALSGRTVSFTVEGSAAGSGTTDASGVASVSFVITEALGTGAKTIEASFAGDECYGTSTGAGTLTVSHAETEITVDPASGEFGTTVNLSATLLRSADSAALAGRTIEFKVEGTGVGSGATNASGSAAVSYTIPEGLGAGGKTITGEFAGDALYSPSSGTGTLTVTKYPTVLTVDSKTGAVGQNVTLSATLSRSVGGPLVGRTVSFTVDGTNAGSATTDASGVASVPYAVDEGPGPGERAIGVGFEGDALHASASGAGTLSVTKAGTDLYTIDRTSTITEAVILRQYDLTRTTDGILLSGRTIVFRIDGTQVGTGTTNAGGDSSLTWTVPSGSASRVITAQFAGDASHDPSSDEAILTALTWATKLAGFDRTARITQRTELKARLLRTDNVPLASKNIGFSVDGTFVITRPTDVQGYARYPYYDVPDGAGAGVRAILSEWAGSGGYLPSSKTTSLTVLKALPYIWVQPKTVALGAKASLYAYFRRLYDYQKQAGKPITFLVDGTAVQSVSTDANGVARYLYQTVEAVGDHTVRCTFSGDAWVEAGYSEGLLRIY